MAAAARRVVVLQIAGALILSASAGAGEVRKEGFGFEFLDSDSGFQEVPEFRFGVLIHAVVASDREPVPDHLPITIVGYAGGRRQFEVMIPNDPSRHCRGPDGCSADLGRIDDPGDGAIVIEARNRNGELLIRHVQGSPEAAMGTGGEKADAAASEGDGGSSGTGALVGAGIAVGVVAATGAGIAIRRRRRASGSQVLTTTTHAQRGELEAERGRLQDEIDALDREIDELGGVRPEVREPTESESFTGELEADIWEAGVGSALRQAQRRKGELEEQLEEVERKLDGLNGDLPGAPEPGGPAYEG